MKLLVGLGNPGERYARNRHNVGFMALSEIARTHALPAWKRRFQGHTTEGTIDGERCLLLVPGTYMNESGRAVGEAMRFLKLEPADVVVFHDELDLAPGKLKVKTGGGNAGHNGLRSISAHCGNEFVRVRIGIGHPGSKDVVQHYVLNDFAKADQAWLKPLLEAMASAAGWLAKGEAERFMTEVARLTRPEPERKPERPRTADPAAETPPPARATEPAGPAPGGALADKLKRWLTSKDRRH